MFNRKSILRQAQDDSLLKPPKPIYSKVMKNLRNILILILAINLIQNCKKKDWRDEMADSEEKFQSSLAKDHEFLVSLKKSSYVIANSSKSRDDAIQIYLSEVLTNEDTSQIKYAMNQQELREILYPNTLGVGTSLDKTKLSDYESIIWERFQLGQKRILEKWNKNSRLIKIHWSETVRDYGVLKGHKPESIEIISQGRKLKIEQIRQVIEHNGQFKVAIVSP